MLPQKIVTITLFSRLRIRSVLPSQVHFADNSPYNPMFHAIHVLAKKMLFRVVEVSPLAYYKSLQIITIGYTTKHLAARILLTTDCQPRVGSLADR